MAGDTASQLVEFYDTYGGEDAFTPEYRQVIETMLLAEDDIDSGNYAAAGNRLAAVWDLYPIGDASWWNVSANNDAINTDKPPAYAAYRMLQQLVDDADLITSTTPEHATMTVLLPGCSEGPIPTSLAELENGTSPVQQRFLDPRVQADDYAVLRDSSSLYQKYFLAVTDGRLDLTLEFVELPNFCMEYAVSEPLSATDTRYNLRPTGQSRTDLWNALAPEHKDSDAYWLTSPSMLPSTFANPVPELQEVPFVNGGITRVPSSAPLLIGDDLWFLEKQAGLGSGVYTEVERRTYFPHWFQHEFFHAYFWEYPEFGLEAESHQWFDASTWPSDFEDYGSRVKESDYYTEALNKRLKTAEVHPSVQFKKSPTAPPSPELFESLNIDDMVGQYRFGTVNGEIGADHRWRTDLGSNFAVTDELDSGRLGTELPGEFFSIVLQLDSNGQHTSEIAGFEFRGHFYKRVDESLPLHDFTVSTFAVDEGNATNTTDVVTVTRSGNTSVASTIDVELHGHTARPDSDFAPGPITVSFAANEISKALDLTLLGDTTVEHDETLALTLVSGAGGGQLGVTITRAILTIENDDAYYDFSAPSFSVPEGDSTNTTNVVEVTRSGETDFASTIDVELTGTTATAGVDFAGGSCPGCGGVGCPQCVRVNFAPDETTKNVSIELLGDTIVELDEEIELSFAGGDAGEAQPKSTLIISNDDSATVSISDAPSVDEGGNLIFDVTLSAPVEFDTVVVYSTVDGTATTGDSDYVGQARATVMIPAGSTTAQINVATTDDNVLESDEDLSVRLDYVASNSLLAYYNFDGQSDNQFGPAPDATLEFADIGSAGSGYTGGGADHALDLGGAFNGATAGVGAGTHFDSAFSNDSVAVSFWQFNTDVAADTTSFWLSSPDEPGQRGFVASVPWSDGTIYFDHTGCCDAGQRLTATGAVQGEWQHFVFQKDAIGTKQIWIDGVKAAESGGANPLFSFDGGMNIGSTNVRGTSFAGRIDEFAVWDETLTPAEISDLAGGAPTLEVGGPAITITGNLATGTILNDDVQLFYDFSAASYDAPEGDDANDFDVTVERSGSTETASTVDVVLTGANAVAGEDFTAGPISVSFAAGETTKNISVEVLGDTTVELDETIVLSFGNFSANAQAGTKQPSAKVTIANDDSATVSIDDAEIAEGGELTFEVTLSNPVEIDTVVAYSTSDGSATTADSDYVAQTDQTITIPAGDTTAQIAVETTDDGEVESNENLSVSISGIAKVSPASLLAYYNFDGQSNNQFGPAPDASLLGPAAIGAGGSGYTGTGSDGALDLGARDNDAAAVLDAGTHFDSAFSNDSIAVSFWQYNTAPNLTSSFWLDSLDAAGSRGVQAHANGAIIFDHAGCCDAGQRMRSSGVIEGQWQHLVFQKDATGSKQVWVDGALRGLADNVDSLLPFDGVMYIGSGGVQELSFAGRIDEFSVWNSALTPEQIGQLAGGAPTLSITSRNVVLGNDQGTGTILNDDGETREYDFTAGSYAVDEGNDTNTTNEVTITRSGNISEASTVDVVLTGTTATENEDFTAGPITVSFAVGDTHKTVPVQILGETLVELDEVIALSFDNFSAGGQAGTTFATSTLTILPDDSADLTIADASVTEGGDLVFDVTLSSPVDVDVVVAYETSDVTAATADNDYTDTATGSVTIPVGQTSTTITVSTTDDSAVEPDETLSVSVRFTNASDRNVIEPSSPATGTILNDDENFTVPSQPTVAISDATVTEGGDLVFDVTLSEAVGEDTMVTYTVVDGTATRADNDYGTGLIHRFSFSEMSGTQVYDSVGGAHGVVIGTGHSWGAGTLSLPGGPSDSEASYVDLPNGLISGLTDVTIEGWFTSEDADYWDRIFDFGDNVHGELNGPTSSGTGAANDSITLNAAQSDVAIVNDQAWMSARSGGATGNHFAVVFDADGGSGVGESSLALYRDGVYVTQVNAEVQLSQINDVNNWLGRSNYTWDTNTSGSYDEFRIYDQALSASHIASSFAAGAASPATTSQTLTIPAGSTTAQIIVKTTDDRRVEPDETLYVNVGDAPVAGGVGGQLLIDFNSTNQDGGPHNDTVAGFSAYNAGHEVASDFVTQTYSAFGANVGVTPSWPNTTDNRVQQMIDRTAANDPNWMNAVTDLTATPPVFGLDFVTDFIGIDTRTGNGGNGNWDGTNGTPTHLNIALSDLPVGHYSWQSVHQDTENVHVEFQVSLSVDGGSTFTALANGRMVDATDGGNPNSVTTGFQSALSQDSAMLDQEGGIFSTNFAADGTNDVVLQFTPLSQVSVHRQIFGINGFMLTKTETSTGDQAVGTILNDDVEPLTVSISDAAVTEGADLVFDVSLTRAVDSDTVVTYSTSDGTATIADNDYVPQAGETVTIPAGSMTTQVIVPTTADNVVEPDENLSVSLGGATHVSPSLLAYYNFDGQSANQAGPAPDASLVGPATIGPAGSGYTGTGTDGSLDLGSSNNGAAAVLAAGTHFDSAYDNNSMAVSFWQYNTQIQRSSSFWFTSPDSNDNQRGFQAHVPWSDGTIYFDHAGCCSSPSQRFTTTGAVTGAWQHFVFQKDAGGNKQIWIDGVSVSQTGAGPLLPFNGVTHIGASIPVSGDTPDISLSGRIDEFAVWDSTLSPAQISELAGGAATLSIGASVVEVEDSQAIGTILDDDTAIVSVGDTSVIEGGDLVFDVTLSAPVAADTVVAYSTSDGSATVADNDYTQHSGQTVTIPAGETTAQVVVTTTDDDKVEPDQTLSLNLNGFGSANLLAYYNFDGQSANQAGPAPNASLVGPATIGPAGSGYTGTGTDGSLDLGSSNNGAAAVLAAGTHFDSAYDNNSMAVSFWQYNTQIQRSSSFWFTSPDSNDNQRGFQAHVPWSDGTIYFDHAGCCSSPSQRFTTTGAVTGEWQHFVFQKDAGGNKQIWIDGVSVSQTGAGPLLPFNGVTHIGASSPVSGDTPDISLSGRIDEFAVWDATLTPEQIGELAGGASTLSLSNHEVAIEVALGTGTILNDDGETLLGHWTFEPGVETVDLTGNFGDLTLNGATVSGGALDVGVNAWARGVSYDGPEIREKTLVSFVRLDSLDVRAGSALTIDKTNSDVFDGIVYAELQAGHWMAGSNNFARTVNPNPGFEETTTGNLVCMAISYEDVAGSAGIKIYHDGDLIGDYTKGSLATWSGDNTEVIFGTRHTVGNATRGWLDAQIEEARIYDGALNQSQIQSLCGDNSSRIFGSTTASVSADATSHGGDLQLFDPDDDPNAPFASFVAQNAVATTHGTFSLTLAGGWTYVPNAGLNGGEIDVIDIVTNDGTTGSITINIVSANQADADGADDSVENAVDFGGVVGDGNGDGILDSAQSNVASLPSAGPDAPYVTVVVPEGVDIANVVTQPLPVSADEVAPPINVEFPLGFVQFETPPAPATPGGATQVEIFFDPNESFNTYYKFGPTPDNPEPHYYEFTFDPVTGTGAEFFSGRVVLHLKDGERGDADGEANGVIADPGALAFSSDVVTSDQSFGIDENSTNGTIVGTLVATQINGDPLTYSLATPNAAFDIEASGKIVVADQRLLNFEENRSFKLDFQVTDGSSTAEGIATVSLGNENEFYPTVQILSVDGRERPGLDAVTLLGTASDPDEGDISDSLSWTSSIDGPLGNGASIATPLSAGNHVITALVTDFGGLKYADSMDVYVPESEIGVGLSGDTWTTPLVQLRDGEIVVSESANILTVSYALPPVAPPTINLFADNGDAPGFGLYFWNGRVARFKSVEPLPTGDYSVEFTVPRESKSVSFSVQNGTGNAALHPDAVDNVFADVREGVGIIETNDASCNDLAGDANCDDVVGFADFAILARHFGRTSAGREHGDLDGDGRVGFADFAVLAVNFGKRLGD